MKKTIRRLKGKMRKVKNAFRNSILLWLYKNTTIVENQIFAESRNGKELAGNILRLIQEVQDQKGNSYQIVVPYVKEKKADIEALIQHYKLQSIKLCRIYSLGYYRELFKSKYLFNDVTFPAQFIKKSEQIYLNVWHGTPYKAMGKDSVADCVKIDNMQRNFFMSDFLLFPNDYCKNVMINAYCLDGMYKGTILKEGYPRNTVFFDQMQRDFTRNEYGLNNKRVYIYMPTFRQELVNSNNVSQVERLSSYFSKIDEQLFDNEVFYVKLHNLVQKELVGITNNQYKHIRFFPKGIETYEFLNCADVLITDYSSVFYDFAVTHKKIILFPYDEEEYMSTRGFYNQPVPHPFSKVYTVDDLLKEMRNTEIYDDSLFYETYCTFENSNATKHIIDEVINKNNSCQKESVFDDKRENVLLLSGIILRNGITTSLNNLLNSIDDHRYYYVSFFRSNMANKAKNLDLIEKRDLIYEIRGHIDYTITEFIARHLYFRYGMYNSWINNRLKSLYSREFSKAFYGTNFSHFIQFNGYDRTANNLFVYSNVKHKVIFVHNDMVREIELKGNQHFQTLKQAYSVADKVAVVSSALINPTFMISGRKDNIVVVSNIQNYAKIESLAEKEATFDENSSLFYGEDIQFDEDNLSSELKIQRERDLFNEFCTKHSKIIVTIGRFSKEKNHEMLIDAFTVFRNNHPEYGLLIIGGYGNLYEKTKLLAKGNYDICIIKAISNPYAFLKKCDLFVLSSQYEGQPMVLFEATYCGLPCFTTNTTGSKEFMEEHGGFIVDNSISGLVEGMEAYDKGKVMKMNIDFEKHNSECKKSFEKLFS